MRVYLRLSGPLRVVVGTDAIELTLSGESATVAQALEGVCAHYPQARPDLIRSTTLFHWWPKRIRKRQGPRRN